MATVDYKEYRYFKGEAKNPYPKGTVEKALWRCERQYFNKWLHGYEDMPYTSEGISLDLYMHMKNALSNFIPKEYKISAQEAGKAYYKDIASLLKYYHWESNSPYKANTPASYFWLYEQDFIYRWACKFYSDKEPAKAFDEFKQYLFNELLPEKWGGSPDFYKQQYKEGGN